MSDGSMLGIDLNFFLLWVGPWKNLVGKKARPKKGSAMEVFRLWESSAKEGDKAMVRPVGGGHRHGGAKGSR